jgi:quercetin dioxygenase-like cupin family protein
MEEINMLTDRTWLRTTASALALFAAVAIATPAAGQTAHHPEYTATTADKLVWRPNPNPALSVVQVAVLHGHPAKEGPLVMRLKFPAGFVLPPHTHPREAQMTVISGAIGHGIGEKVERDKAPLLPAGSFFLMTTVPHFAWFPEETVVQVNGTGPWVLALIKKE